MDHKGLSQNRWYRLPLLLRATSYQRRDGFADGQSTSRKRMAPDTERYSYAIGFYCFLT